MTYVPVSAQLPVERAKLLFSISGAQCVLADARQRDRATEFASEAPNATLEAIVEHEGGAAPAHNIGKSDDIAIIQFTSGSTGIPKVVPVSQRNIAAFVDWWIDHFGVDGSDRVATSNPYNFGASFLDTYATILAGARNYIIPQQVLLFPQSLAEWLSVNRISRWYTIPSVLVPLAERGEFAGLDMSAMRNVSFAGEVMRSGHIRSLCRKLPNVAFTGFYGSTEARELTHFPITPDFLSKDEDVPAGYILPIVDLQLLDDAGEFIAQSDRSGEVCVSGPGVMKGYLNQENAKCFIQRQGREYFRTGDLGEFRDGVLYLLGRADHQIKTRGYRVNLNEIESLVAAAPSVAQSIVVAVPDARFGNLLVAFVSPKPGESLDEASLRHHLARIAPRYMIPEKIILAAYLPSAATGKVDRSLLKARAIEMMTQKSPPRDC